MDVHAYIERMDRAVIRAVRLLLARTRLTILDSARLTARAEVMARLIKRAGFN